MTTRPPGTPDVDLTYDGASGTINGAVFMTGQFQQVPDHFSSFLEIRNNGTEQGYNTDGTLQYNDRDVQNSTHSILLANVPIVIGDGSHGTTEGVAYREFRLNIAEAGNTKQFLSLDALQIWQEESGSLTNFTPGTGFAGSHTNYLAYNMDSGGDHWVGLLEPQNGNGASQTEFTILIPDSDFLNDPSHRYITLYTKMGQQVGWEADSGSEEYGLSVSSAGPTPAMTIHETATVPGGTADHAGEIISYAITVANVGDVTLTGFTVTDPGVSDLAAVLSGGFNAGDTNQDGQFSPGETWQYTASYTVTQADLDSNGGGRGAILNTAFAGSTETGLDTAHLISASTSITVVQNSSLEVTKTPDVSAVHAAGDVINYAIAVQNAGTTGLTGVVVTDPQFTLSTPVLDFTAPILGPSLLVPLLVGDYNVGDTNEDGIEDFGETFQYAIAGDDNNNGIQDLGETFVLTNVGDTNRNGNIDPGETFQFYNAGDTNQNGVQDSGETFQINVSHILTLNSGDTNSDGVLNPGETWHYSVSYTLTQDDIDNGGVVQSGLTHNNTTTVMTDGGIAGGANASVTIVQNPHLMVTKTASTPGGIVDHAGQVISYAINIANDGNMTLTTPVVSDPSVSNLTFVSGDTDADGKIDVDETWHYTASYTVTQGDIDSHPSTMSGPGAIDNTASATTHEGASGSSVTHVPVDYDPEMTVTKTATVPGGTADTAGEVISYAIDVANTGNVTLTSPAINDPSVSDLTYVSGDTNNDGKLDVNETWTYTGSHTVTQPEMDAGGSINNTATADTAQTDPENASASVTVQQNPAVTLLKAGTFADDNNDGFAEVGEHINYTFTITNTGNVTLHNLNVADADAGVSVSGSPIASLGPAASDSTTWTASYAITQTDINNGSFVNTASVTATEASASDSATVTLPAPPPTYGIAIDDNNHLSQLSDPGGDGPTVGDPIQFFFQITNLGNTTLTNVAVNDTLGDAVSGSLQTAVPTTLAGNATFGDTFNHFLTAADLSSHHVIDDITVTALDQTSATQTATYHYDFLV